MKERGRSLNVLPAPNLLFHILFTFTRFFYQENLWKSLILISQIFLIIRCKKSSEIQHCIFTTFVHQKSNFLLPNHEFDKSVITKY